MLDLGGDICYNVITSKGFFFFAKEPVKIASEYVVQCFLHLSKCCVQVRHSAARPREAFTFTVSGFRRELVKAKNISVKREVPL